MGGDQFLGQIEEIPRNITGLVDTNDHCYTVTDIEDDLVQREYSTHFVYDDRGPDTSTRLLISCRQRMYRKKNTAIHRMAAILEATKGRSVHFPRLVAFGKIRRLFYGIDGEQEAEHDPEGKAHVCAVIQYDGTYLGALMDLSPTGLLGIEMAIVAGIGVVRALASLHRLGYVHRLVTPFSFSFPNPLTLDGLEAGLLITDLSLALKWPCKPRGFVPFVGSKRYSSVRAQRGREQGPADDIISLIYMVAEFISGKLPWRSVRKPNLVANLKSQFYLFDEFKRIPQEIRGVFREMHLINGCAIIDHRQIVEEFTKALNRRCPKDNREMPYWASLPVTEGC